MNDKGTRGEGEKLSRLNIQYRYYEDWFIIKRKIYYEQKMF